MKTKIILSFLVLCLAAKTNAKIITVSNNLLNAGHFTDVQTACDSAKSGDTIYVMGSLTMYNASANISVTNPVTIIGAGYNLTGTQYNWPTILSGITIGTKASGTKIMGINSYWVSAADTNVKNVVIDRCYLSYINITGNGWIVQHNILSSYVYLTYSPVLNATIRNNFIGYYGVYGAYPYNDKGLIVDHNIITNACSSLQNAIFTNNIFFYANQSASSSCKYNTFSNNVTVYSSKDSVPYGTNGGGQNIYNPKKLFVNGPTSSISIYASGIASYDWHIQNASPAHKAGSDTTDIGIYGGDYPMINLTGATTLPQMTYMSITTPNIPANAKLNVHFRARKQN